MAALRKENGCIRGSMAVLEKENGCIREGAWLH